MTEDERCAEYDPTCGGCVAGLNPWHSHKSTPGSRPALGASHADQGEVVTGHENEIPVVRYRQALTYISSPTMGLPGGRDALDFVDEASEANLRVALKACIRTARAALNG